MENLDKKVDARISFDDSTPPSTGGYVPVIKIDPLEAAIEQFETAVSLYFLGAGKCSVHTLVGAAHEVLGGIHTQRARTDGELAPLTSIFEGITPKEIVGTSNLNDIRNSLKHYTGDRRSKSPYELDDLINFTWIVDCTTRLAALGKIDNDMILLLCLWAKHMQENKEEMAESVFQRYAEKVGGRYIGPAIAPQTKWAILAIRAAPDLKVPAWFSIALEAQAPLSLRIVCYKRDFRKALTRLFTR